MRIGYLLFQGNPNATGGPLTVKVDDVSEKVLFTLTEDEATELAQYLADQYLPPEDNHHQGLRMLLVTTNDHDYQRDMRRGVDYVGFNSFVDEQANHLSRFEVRPRDEPRHRTHVYEVEVIEHVELSVKATVERKEIGNI